MSNRVVVEFQGGLGNQLFQLAAGMSLACRMNCVVEADLRAIRARGDRQFELDGWLLPVHVIRDHAGLPNRDPGAIGAFRRRAGGLLGEGFRIISDSDCARFDRVSAGRFYLRGFWQQLSFAVQARQAILRALESQIGCSETIPAIAVHVRRGDYVTDQRTKAVHGAQPASYYRMAIACLRRKLGALPVSVFSDEPEWAVANLGDVSDTTFAERGSLAVEHLQLMSRHVGHVISNSTFSWWGAFLARDTEVVAPVRWFVDTHRIVPPIFPERWQRI